jgi:TP53 regulating kinase-like protein
MDACNKKKSKLSLCLHCNIAISKKWCSYNCWQPMTDVPLTDGGAAGGEGVVSATPSAVAEPSARAIIYRGAEAVIEELVFLGLPAILKTRLPKSYRLPQLEKMITRERTVGEVRCLRRCWALGIRVPLVYCVNVQKGIIVMERVPGATVKKHLLQMCGPDDHPVRALHQLLRREERCTLWCLPARLPLLSLVSGELVRRQAIAQLVGSALAALHDSHIVHGDLTTSNMLVEHLPAKPSAAGEGTAATSAQPSERASRRLVRE